MTTFEALDKEQRVRLSVQRDVQLICSEACHFLGMDITKPAMDLLLDLFFYKMSGYADDLERFAKHAKRSTITGDDCRLLTRKNQTLTTHINSLKQPGLSTKETAKRRRTVTTTAAVSSPAKRARALETTIATTTDRVIEGPNEPEIADAAIDLTFD